MRSSVKEVKSFRAGKKVDLFTARNDERPGRTLTLLRIPEVSGI